MLLAMKILSKSLNTLTLAGLLFIVPAYSNTLVRAQSPPTSAENASEKILTRDELYFGLSKPNGKMVSEGEWQLFLRHVITPRFPDGLTVMDGYGQYLNTSGTVTREKTKLIILVYENSPNKSHMIAEIISKYKQTFHQESVLRLTSTVRASF